MPIVHGVPPSPFVRKVRVFLAEKGVAYELDPLVPFNQPPEYFEISPLGKIPCYQDGDFALPDSSAICAYLERKHPEPPLYPANAEELGRALWLEEYGDTRLAESVGPIFFQTLIRPTLFKQEADKELVEKTSREVLPPVLDYLEKQAPDGDAIVGRTFSIADIGIATQFVQLRHAGHELDPSRWPRLTAWVDRVLARPSFAACFEDEKQAFAAGG